MLLGHNRMSPQAKRLAIILGALAYVLACAVDWIH